MNKPYTFFFILILISFQHAKAVFDGDSTTFRHNNLELFNAETKDAVASIREGIRLIVNNEADNGIKLLCDAVSGIRFKTKEERNYDYQTTEFFSLLNDLRYNRTTEDERELGILFMKRMFTTRDWSFDKTIYKYLRKYPNSLFINRISLLYATYFLTGDELDARIKKLLALNSDLLSANIAQAEYDYSAENYPECIGYFKKTIHLFPEYAYAYKHIGLSFYELDQSDSALQNYSKAITLFPNDAIVYLHRGNAWMNLKQYDSSICDYRRAIRISPDYDWPYNNIALAYKYKSQNDSALYYFNKVIRMSSSTAQFFDNRGDFYYDLDNYQKAILDYSRAIDLNPSHTHYYVDRGDAYYFDNETDLAIYDFTKAVQLDAGYKYAYKRIADCYYVKNYFKQAVAFCNKAIQVDSSYKHAYIRLGLSYGSLEDYPMEIKAFKKAVEIDSVFDSALGNLGWAYYCVNEYDSCILYSQKAIRIDEKAYYAKFNIALSKLRQGKIEEAKALYITYLDQYTKSNSGDPEITGGPDGALEDLHNLLDKNIQVDEVNDILKNIFRQ
jgi:tetratricopeptide (TPR) repeat protein